MPCMCGDTACPSCGPAQGYDPGYEVVCDWIFEVWLADYPKGIDRDWLAEDLADRLGKCLPQDLVDALYEEAKKWFKEWNQRYK